jgi:hypothetical protein
MASTLPRWTGGSGLPVTVDAVGGITAHAQSLTVLFDSFRITPPSRAGQSTTHTVAFRVVLEAARHVHLCITQQLRGQVFKGAESRILLTSILGPSVLVHEFPYGEAFDDGIEIQDENDFVQYPRQPLTGIVTVLIEQREHDVPILVALESLDVRILPGLSV